MSWCGFGVGFGVLACCFNYLFVGLCGSVSCIWFVCLGVLYVGWRWYMGPLLLAGSVDVENLTTPMACAVGWSCTSLLRWPM